MNNTSYLYVGFILGMIATIGLMCIYYVLCDVWEWIKLFEQDKDDMGMGRRKL